MRKICSKIIDILVNFKNLKEWFMERGYREDMVIKEINKVLGSPFELGQ